MYLKIFLFISENKEPNSFVFGVKNFLFCVNADVEDEELVQKQVEFINSELNMGVNVENIISDADVAASLQNASAESTEKVIKHKFVNTYVVCSFMAKLLWAITIRFIRRYLSYL